MLLLDPDSPTAAPYAGDMKEPELIPKIKRSIEKLLKIREEFNRDEYSGSFEILLYPQMPTCYALVVDPQNATGCIHISHYLNGLKKADTLVIEVHVKGNQILFAKYWDYVRRVEAIAKKAE